MDLIPSVGLSIMINFPSRQSQGWDIVTMLFVFAVFLWRLHENASSFDSTEIRTIGEAGAFAIGAVSWLAWFRHKKPGQ